MNSDAFAEFIGKKWGDEVTETKLKEKGQFNKLRVLEPGSMTTMDFIEDRLNVNVDETKKIVSFNFS